MRQNFTKILCVKFEMASNFVKKAATGAANFVDRIATGHPIFPNNWNNIKYCRLGKDLVHSFYRQSRYLSIVIQSLRIESALNFVDKQLLGIEFYRWKLCLSIKIHSLRIETIKYLLRQKNMSLKKELATEALNLAIRRREILLMNPL